MGIGCTTWNENKESMEIVTREDLKRLRFKAAEYDKAKFESTSGDETDG